MSADGELNTTTWDVRNKLLKQLDHSQGVSPRELFVLLSNATELMEAALAVRDQTIYGVAASLTKELKAASEYMERFHRFFPEDSTPDDGTIEEGGEGNADSH